MAKSRVEVEHEQMKKSCKDFEKRIKALEEKASQKKVVTKKATKKKAKKKASKKK